jgi:hypothetical protein
MWDSLGVLGLKGGSSVVRARTRFGAHARDEPMLPFAGFTLGGPIVPRVESPARRLLAGLAAWRGRLGELVTALGSAEADELHPLRVSTAEAEPPLLLALLRLGAWILAGAVALSAVVYVTGVLIARAAAGFID